MPADAATPAARHTIIEQLIAAREAAGLTTAQVVERSGGKLATTFLRGWEDGFGNPSIPQLMTWARSIDPFKPMTVTYQGRQLKAERPNPEVQILTDAEIYGPETAGGFRAAKDGFDAVTLMRRQIDRDPGTRAAYEAAHIDDEVAAILGLKTNGVGLSQIPADRFTLAIADYQPIDSIDIILDAHWAKRASGSTVQQMANDLVAAHGIRAATVCVGLTEAIIVARWCKDPMAEAPQRGEVVRDRLEVAWAATKRLTDSMSTREAVSVFRTERAPGHTIGLASDVATVTPEVMFVVHRAAEGRPPRTGTESYGVIAGTREIGEAPTKTASSSPAVAEAVTRRPTTGAGYTPGRTTP